MYRKKCGPTSRPLVTSRFPPSSLLLWSPLILQLGKGGSTEGTLETKHEPCHFCFRGPLGRDSSGS